MKRLVLLAAIAAQATIASAQWTMQTIDADELAGTKSDIAYMYTDSITGNTFVYYANMSDQYMIHSKEKVFDYKSGYAQYVGHYCGINVTVGLYTASGTLKEKFKMWLDVNPSGGANHARTRNAGKLINPVGQGKKVKKIVSHINNSDGYVRILADLFEGGNFDMKIPHR